MLPLGHVAVALATADVVGGNRLAAGIASQAPDLIDKPLAWVFKTTKSSRFVAHTLVATLAFSSVAWVIGGEKTMRGVAAGYATHLAADQVLGGKVPFLWPLRRYRLGHGRLRLKPQSLAIELIAGAYLYSRWSLARG